MYPVFVAGTGSQTAKIRTTSSDFRFVPGTSTLQTANIIGSTSLFADTIQSWATAIITVAGTGGSSEVHLSSGNAAYKCIASSAGNWRPDTDNGQSIGTSGKRWSVIYAATGTINTSDQREKTGITTSALGSDFIKSLKPVSYKWKVGKNVPLYEKDADGNIVLDENGDPKYLKDENNNVVFGPVPGERTHWGFLAQEVKQSVDAAGVDFAGWVLADKDDPNSSQGLRYDQFIAPLTKALQEALERIEELEERVSILEQT